VPGFFVFGEPDAAMALAVVSSDFPASRSIGSLKNANSLERISAVCVLAKLAGRQLPFLARLEFSLRISAACR
jgi:hypothetical protein